MAQLLEVRSLPSDIASLYRSGFIKPHREVSAGISFSFDEALFEKDPEAAHRVEKTVGLGGSGLPYLVADVSDWEDNWFALDLPLNNAPTYCVLRLKGYPFRYLHPKLHYCSAKRGFMEPEDHQELELPAIGVFEQFANMKIALPELPDDAFRKRLSIYVPACSWFVLGFESLKVYGHA
jgi:hypothetical protein